jgi:RNA polymerase sigma factor (sigma-70 family)
MEPSDLELLRDYARKGEEEAFTSLIKRHSGWVFAASRRRLRAAHLADDATQAVFTVLLCKAAQLAEMDGFSVQGWLFHVMHLTCMRLRRTIVRRTRHEAKAGMLRQVREQYPDPPEDELLMLLEDAISQLPMADRDVLVKRFYQGASLSSIGSALGISADAARKRITRALEVVRTFMIHDGADALPGDLLQSIGPLPAARKRLGRPPGNSERVNVLAKGTMIMVTQAEAIDFTVVSAEFFVKDVEANLDFFEKLGFRRHYTEPLDAMGRMPRASLRGGSTARIWLRRASESEGTRPQPGVGLFFWIKGGVEALAIHRNSIAGQGVPVSQFFDDISLR